ncbi:transcriptional regulator with PAS, ATPase and Fis domain [Chryseobacterium sp. SORGH_AS 447]|uniref:transposase n=1 Tax=Chryseobacterium sp. SORGH_AS_0447 TaxID=3041769 RepID=UPI00278A263B|nr:transposase [Chryseobacterium sp. SORGH_AS_0447]MDQ1162420.1 transcriptional regulator with PAS, ATPase and Fis domain [Chryseobacterium sp. SORGH_AS_0447]
MNFKEIHIGELIKKAVKDRGIETSRICTFLNCNVRDIPKMYKAQTLNTDTLLRWSKLLEYDFFRIYTQHLILFSPQASERHNPATANKKSTLLQFRKNIYTKEIIEFILEQIKSGEMTKKKLMERYRIPKTTLYKWISKYNVSE